MRRLKIFRPAPAGLTVVGLWVVSAALWIGTLQATPSAGVSEIVEFAETGDGDARISWTSEIGVEYRLQYSQDLRPGSFVDVRVIVADSELTTVTQAFDDGRGYFRIAYQIDSGEGMSVALYGDEFFNAIPGHPAPHRTLQSLTGGLVLEEGNPGETALQIASRFADGPYRDLLAAMLHQPGVTAEWTPASVALGYANFRDAVTRTDGNYIAVVPANRRPYDGSGWGTSNVYVAGVQSLHQQLRDLIYAEHAPERVFDWWRWATRCYTPLDAADVDDMIGNGESIIPRSMRLHGDGDRNGERLNAVGNDWLGEGLYHAYLRLESPEWFTATDKAARFYPLDGSPWTTQIEVIADNHAELQGAAPTLKLQRGDGRFGQALKWTAGVTQRAVAPHFELGEEFAFEVWVRPGIDGTRVFQMFGGGGGVSLLTSGGQIRSYAGVAALELAQPYNLGEWNHVYYERVGGVISLRVNGAEAVSRSLPTMEWGTDPLFIGSNSYGTANFQGSLHSLVFYGEGLTESEYQQRFNAGLGAPLLGLQGLNRPLTDEWLMTGELRPFWQSVYGAAELLPNLDEDGDGASNVEESYSGTDPYDSGSVFEIVGELLVETGRTALRWTAIEGRVYQLQGRDANEPEAVWLDEGAPIDGLPGEMVIALDPVVAQGREYRIQVEDPSGRPDPDPVSGALLLSHDADGDGSIDYEEFVAGTNPNDPASFLQLSVEPDAVVAEVQVRTVQGMSYQLQRSAGEAWVAGGEIFRGNGGVIPVRFIAPSVEVAVRFRRVILDSDADGASDWEEFWAGSDPLVADSSEGFSSDLAFIESVGNATPSVHIQSENGVANATSGRAGRILIRRGAWPGALHVNLTTGGDAELGVDYEALPSSISLPMGVDEVAVDIVPLEGGGEPSKSLTIGAQVAAASSAADPVEIRILRESVLSVADFGAVGDGVVDDRLAVQAAIDALASDPSYNRLHFPAGRYRLNSQISSNATWTSHFRILKLSHEGMDDRDLIITGDPGAILFSTVSPVRAHMLEIKARYRSLRFEGITFEKDPVPLSYIKPGAEPNGADAIAMVLHDDRFVDALEFEDCTFINCHGAVFMYAQGYDIRGHLKRFSVTGCQALNPYGSNTIRSLDAFGGGQQFYLTGWVGRAIYRNNLFDGGGEDMTDQTTSPGGRVKDGGHFGHPSDLVFEDNIVKRMGVEALFHTSGSTRMGSSQSQFVMPPVDGSAVEVATTDWLSTFKVGDILNIRGDFSQPGFGVHNIMRVEAVGEGNTISISNVGTAGNAPAGTLFPSARAIYRDTEDEGSHSLIRRNYFDGTVPPGGDVGSTYIGIVTNARSSIRDNTIVGIGRAIGVFEEVRTPLHPGSRGTIVENNLILTRDSETPGNAATSGIISAGVEDRISKNLILLPKSTYASGIFLNGKRTVATGNTVIAVDIRVNGYNSAVRSVGLSFGNEAERVEFRGNSSRGFDVGVGHGSANQTVLHLVLDHESYLDQLAIDPRGVVGDWPD